MTENVAWTIKEGGAPRLLQRSWRNLLGKVDGGGGEKGEPLGARPTRMPDRKVRYVILGWVRLSRLAFLDALHHRR